ncbi:MAG: hypothetical protein CM1200mP22_26190 [Dehalococcoidia bacterium]|nr:MAG: hypothetical protein CM1200mP22_26190 [Dehalococcoidia bacterium]
MSTTVMQTQSDDEFRGRVMSLHQLTWGSMALGSLMMGVIAEFAGVSMAIGLGGYWSWVVLQSWLYGCHNPEPAGF